MSAARSYAKSVEVGETMVGQGVARVEASHHPDYTVGDIVLAPTGWQTALLSDGTGLIRLDHPPQPIPHAEPPPHPAQIAADADHY